MKISENTMTKLTFLWMITFVIMSVFASSLGPISTFAQTPAPTRRVNVPFFDGPVLQNQGVILWFGQVDNTSNYADVRLGYNYDKLVVTLHILDRRLWYDLAPTTADLTAWDAVTLYLHLDGNSSQTPTINSHRFIAQVNHWQARDDYQAAFRGNGSGWTAVPTPFTTTSGWRSENGFNNDQDDRGWVVTFEIPFDSLGLPGPPPAGNTWGLALTLHDRDDSGGTVIPQQTWPEAVDPERPATWGQLVFGQPGYSPPLAAPSAITTVRHGLTGISVADAHVGGHTDCGELFSPNFFDGWGGANYAGYDQINIQNQSDVADWPCFSKYYVTFPLDTLPPGRAIISATLTMYLFGNSNPAQAQPSLIQVFTVAEDWNENTLTWNNAPLALENVAARWVNPVDQFPGWPGVPARWDVSRAVADAYTAGGSLRLALYSADSAYHSGKYFSSSDTEAWNAAARPTLQVRWGEPVQVASQVYLPLIIKPE